jgi:hypothetical protein
MDVLAAIAAKPRQSSGMTAAALVRSIDRDTPTVFLDEVDTQVAGDKEIGEAIRGILNTGSQRGGTFSKCDAGHEIRDFNVYSPKCYAGIGHIWDTVSSRSIAIVMRRKLPGETVEPFRRRDVNTAAEPIKQRLEAWSQMGTVDRLRPMRPAPIKGISDRQNDMAEPLLAIAELAGPEWLGSLTDALHSVFSSQASEDVSATVMLLSDIRDAFEEKKTDRIPSTALVEYLTAIEEHPWAEWYKGKPMTASQVARQLKKHGIHPKVIRFGGVVVKGYLLDDFKQSWARYCPVNVPPENAVTRLQPASSLDKNEISSGYIAVTQNSASSRGEVTDPAHTATAQIDHFHLDQGAANQHEQRSVTALPFVTANRGDERMSDSEVRI